MPTLPTSSPRDVIVNSRALYFLAILHSYLSKMKYKWNKDVEFTFLELYEGEPVLWNPNHSSYKDKPRTLKAWTRISERLNVPLPELKKKKESLLSSYRKYRKLVRDSKRSAADDSKLYRPAWFAYDILESFLGKVAHLKNPEIAQSSKDESMDNEEELEEVKENKNCSNNSDKTDIPDSEEPPSRDCQNSHHFNQIRTENFDLNKSNTEEDECDLYGKLLATKLRKLPEYERLQFMYEIDGLFIRRNSNRSRQLVARSYVQSVPSPSLSPPMSIHFSDEDLKREID